MEPDKGRFGPVRLGTICDKCTIDSPCIVRRPVCCSSRQLWEVFFCVDCRQKGLINVSVRTNQLAVFSWDENSPIAQLALKMPPPDVDYN